MFLVTPMCSTKLLDGTVRGPGQLQGHVNSPLLVLHSPVSLTSKQFVLAKGYILCIPIFSLNPCIFLIIFLDNHSRSEKAGVTDKFIKLLDIDPEKNAVSDRGDDPVWPKTGSGALYLKGKKIF